MNAILNGLNSNLDVSHYANPIYSYKQMSIIREALEKKLNVEVLKNPKLTIEEMEALTVLLEFDWLSPDNNEKIVIEKQKSTLQ